LKILLVYPSHLDEHGKPVKYRNAYLPPLGLALLDALTPDPHEVRIVNDLVQEVDFSMDVDLVGLTALTSQAERAYQIAAGFRSRGIPVVLGGVHPSLMAEEARLHADAVVIGEAEDIWETLLADAAQGRLNPTYQGEGFPDLSRAVFPRWKNMDLSVYRRTPGRRLPRIPLFTTRGCVFNCKYCSVSRYFGRSYRFRPVAHVLEEIDTAGGESFFFVDDNIVCRPEYSRELFQALSRRSIRWFGQASTSLLKTPELIELMAKAGCKHLFIGIESIDPESLKGLRKGHNRPEEYGELFSRLLSAGIKPWASLIFGLDNDTEQGLKNTLDFLIRSRIWNIVLWILTPLPGTDLFKEMEEQGRILSRRWSDYDLTHVVFRPSGFTPETLLRLYWESFDSLFNFQAIAGRTLHMARYARHPFRTGFTSLMYQLYFRKQVQARNHPFSMGLGRI
jgi:radical SAM superfamily enzyme YgiQ (UPF0313 family)